MEKSEISNIIISTAQEIGREDENKHLIHANINTELYGNNGNLDSLQLVRLIAGIEEKISSKRGMAIVIADERAMSLKSSPFKNVESLTEYVNKLLV